MDAGDGVRSRSQLIERKIEALEDMATKVRKLILIAAAWVITKRQIAVNLIVMRNKNEFAQNRQIPTLLFLFPFNLAHASSMFLMQETSYVAY